MKHLVILLFSFFAIQGLQAQKCDHLKKGNFRIGPTKELPDEYLISRTEAHQFEENKTTGLKMQFDIKWTSDCSYELSKPKVLKGEPPFPVADSHILYVKITKATTTYYKAEISANFADMKAEMQIQVIQ